jgi:hypothetical protein
MSCISEVEYRLAVTDVAVGRPRMILKLEVAEAIEELEGLDES